VVEEGVCEAEGVELVTDGELEERGGVLQALSSSAASGVRIKNARHILLGLFFARAPETAFTTLAILE
jgi:hypothetical protein